MAAARRPRPARRLHGLWLAPLLLQAALARSGGGPRLAGDDAGEAAAAGTASEPGARNASVDRRLQFTEVRESYPCPLAGVVRNLALADLPSGWELHYEASYSSPTSFGDMIPPSGTCLLWGAGRGRQLEVLSLAAFGDREKIVEKVTAGQTVWENDVLWYLARGKSGGFSQAGAIAIEPGPGDEGVYDGPGRMSWLLNGRGGYRAGIEKDIGPGTDWMKVVYFGPQAVLCESSVCPFGKILKTQDAPKYCRGQACTEDECCMDARKCTPDICPVGSGWILKRDQDLPEFCSTALCLESECCEAAPRCQVSDCPVGSFLKPEGLPPGGRPTYGCKTHVCTVQECCHDSPTCPLKICPVAWRLATLDPTPFCSSSDCLVSDCCVPAGQCSVKICAEDQALDPLAPMYCERPNCTQSECCYSLPPTVSVDGITFIDEDLSADSMGGRIRWSPTALSVPNVTHYALHLDYGRLPLMWVANISYGTHEYDLPRRPLAQKIVIYTMNGGGLQETPAEFLVNDSAFLPTDVQFIDYDLDRGEIGGNIMWTNTFLQWMDNSSVAAGTEGVPIWPLDIVEKVCRFRTSIYVEGGNGTSLTNGTPPVISIGGQRLDNALNMTFEQPGIMVIVLSKDLGEVVQAGRFATHDDVSAAETMAEFLSTIELGTGVIITSFGGASRYVSPRLRSRVALLGATRFADLGLHDSYVLVAMGAGDGRVRESLFSAFAGKGASPRAFVELECPVLGFRAKVTNGQSITYLGEDLGASAVTVPLPAETKVAGPVRVAIEIRSRIDYWNTEPTLIRDIDGTVSKVRFKEKDIANPNDLSGGLVSWAPPPEEAMAVKAYRVYLAGASGVSIDDREQIGPDIPAGKYELECPPGTSRGNKTLLLVYSVSELGEQTTPSAMYLAALIGAVSATMTAAIVGSVAVAQIGRVAASITERFNMNALEKAGTKMDTVKDVPVQIVDTYTCSGEGGDASLSVSVQPGTLLGKMQARQAIAPILPCVQHHDHILHVVFKTRENGEVTKEKFTLHQVKDCKNTWDCDDIVLQKTSNRDITIFDKRRHIFDLRRKPPIIWRLMESGVCSRAAFRMYAPMIMLICISCLLYILGDTEVASILLAIVFGGMLILFVLGKTGVTTEIVIFVKQLPPKRIRGNFWKACQFLVGCFPCAPAFIAGTMVGYLTGAVAISGAALCSVKAFGPAALFEAGAGTSITLYSMYLKWTAQKNGTATEASEATLMAQIMAAALMGVKAMDSYMEGKEILFKTQEIEPDKLLQDARNLDTSMGIGLSGAITLEAFKKGLLTERMMKGRISKVFKEAAGSLVKSARGRLAQIVSDLAGEGGHWPRSGDTLGYAIGRLVDAASMDFYLMELEKARTNNQRRPIQERIGERLQECQDALKQLLNGPLASKSVVRYRACVKEVKQSADELSTDLRNLEQCVGLSHTSAGFVASVEVAGCYAELVHQTAEYVKDEITSGDVSSVDIQILNWKMKQLMDQADRVATVLRSAQPPSPDVRVAAMPTEGAFGQTASRRQLLQPVVRGSEEVLSPHGGSDDAIFIAPSDQNPDTGGRSDFDQATRAALRDADMILESLGEADAVLRMMPMPPTEDQLNKVADYLRDAIAYAEGIKDFRMLVHDAGSSEVTSQALAEATEDIRNRAPGSLRPESLADYAQALCLARAAVGLVAAVSEELMFAWKRADTVVNAMAETRKRGYRTLQLVKEAKDFLPTLQAGQVQRVQDEAIEFATGAPVQALVHLQECVLEPVRNMYACLLELLKQMSDGVDLSSSPSGAVQMLDSNPLRRTTNRTQSARIHPESSLEPVEETDTFDPFATPKHIDASPPKRMFVERPR